METKKIKEILKNVGLGSNEASVYLLLLESGLTPAGQLIKKSLLHRNIVYTALDKLVAKKYASMLSQKGINLYRALEPERVIADIKETLKQAEQILPELKKFRKERKSRNHDL